MTKLKPSYKVSTVESYVSDGEAKNHYTDIGVAWDKGKGFISVQLRNNISVSGKFVIRVPKVDGE